MQGVCLIGCGRIAGTHAGNLGGLVRLGCHSRSQESAARLAAQHGGEVVSRWAEVLRSPAWDGVVICSPPEHHCDQVEAALEAGKTVLVEKPMCVTRDELDRIAAAAAAHPVGRLMVAENYYYKPLLKLLDWFVRRGFLGELEQIHVRKRFQQAATGWRRGYGALLEGGIHFVALVSALAERCGCEAPQRVHAELPAAGGQHPERCSHTRLEYAGGLEGRLDYAWNRRALLRGVLQHSRLRGSDGRIVFESNGLYAALLCRQRHRLYWTGMRDLMGFKAMMGDFLTCLADPAHEPVSNLRRARRDLGVVFDAYASAT